MKLRTDGEQGTVSTMTEMSLSVQETREALGRRVDAAHFLQEATVVTKNGEPRAVLVPYGWYQQHAPGPAQRVLPLDHDPTTGGAP